MILQLTYALVLFNSDTEHYVFFEFLILQLTNAFDLLNLSAEHYVFFEILIFIGTGDGLGSDVGQAYN